MRRGQVIQDALDSRTVNAVIRLKSHCLRGVRQASPHIAGSVLRGCRVNQSIKGEAEFVGIEEVLVETEFRVIGIGELAAGCCELLPHRGPDLRWSL